MDLENVRMVLVGRLVASIVHEINNPMQAIRGALALTLEEVEDVEAVQAYTELCLHETDRVIHLTRLLRQIYRPEQERFELIDLNQVVADVLALARDELNRQRVEVIPGYTPRPIYLNGITSQLELALLHLFLFLIPQLSEAGVRKIQVLTRLEDQQVQVEIILPVHSLPSQASLHRLLSDADAPAVQDEDFDLVKYSLAPIQYIVKTHHGRVQISQHAGQQAICILFPDQSPL